VDIALSRIGSVVQCLEYVADGVILLDAQLRIVHITQAGRRLLETCRDHLTIQNQQLVFTCPDAARYLRQLAGDLVRRRLCGGGN
jgi:hypothetical protein